MIACALVSISVLVSVMNMKRFCVAMPELVVCRYLVMDLAFFSPGRSMS